jgi:hypothetical protein
MEPHDRARAKPWRQRFPDGLIARVLLGLVLLLAFGLCWVVISGGAQRVAVAAITRVGGKVSYNWEATRVHDPDGDFSIPNPNGRPPWNPVLVALLGPDCFGDVVSVDLQRNDKYLQDRLELLRNELSGDLIARQRDADAALAEAGKLPHLYRLAIAFTPVTNAGLDHLRQLTSLESLKLGNLDGTTNDGFKAIEGLTRLRELELESLPLTDAMLSLLPRLTELRRLELEQLNLTDAGMVHLEGLVKLRTLTLDSVPITSPALDRLRRMTHLSTLKIRKTAVQDLGAIRHLAELRELYIMRNPIDDNGLAPVAEHAALEKLDLSHTAVTDAALEHLRNLPRLLHLDLKKTHLTPAAVAEFRKARPRVYVEY